MGKIELTQDEPIKILQLMQEFTEIDMSKMTGKLKNVKITTQGLNIKTDVLNIQLIITEK